MDTCLKRRLKIKSQGSRFRRAIGCSLSSLQFAILRNYRIIQPKTTKVERQPGHAVIDNHSHPHGLYAKIPAVRFPMRFDKVQKQIIQKLSSQMFAGGTMQIICWCHTGGSLKNDFFPFYVPKADRGDVASSPNFAFQKDLRRCKPWVRVARVLPFITLLSHSQSNDKRSYVRLDAKSLPSRSVVKTSTQRHAARCFLLGRFVIVKRAHSVECMAKHSPILGRYTGWRFYCSHRASGFEMVVQ